ncbi:hypothetical protein AU508_08125 [Lonsdalea populi]|nr:hypothetical protein AU508_08125 [Lonsdalea populi]RAT68544.1 hypothetical protein AU505_14940 [Lonsdalea populi]
MRDGRFSAEMPHFEDGSIALTFQDDGLWRSLSQIFRTIAKSAQLLAHFPAQITFCAMFANDLRILRNILREFWLGKIPYFKFLYKTVI